MSHVTVNNSSNNCSGGGISFIGLLTIVFIVLKLLGVITWSWWWVLSPLWIGAALAIAIILIVVFIAIIYEVGNN